MGLFLAPESPVSGQANTITGKRREKRGVIIWCFVDSTLAFYWGGAREIHFFFILYLGNTFSSIKVIEKITESVSRGEGKQLGNFFPQRFVGDSRIVTRGSGATATRHEGLRGCPVRGTNSAYSRRPGRRVRVFYGWIRMASNNSR